LGLILAAVAALSALGNAARADAGNAPPKAGETTTTSVLPLTYAAVVGDNVPVYAHPSQSSPMRTLGAGYSWVSLANAQPIDYDGQTWYQINANEYVRADSLSLYRPSSFKGVLPATHPDHAFAWLVYSVQPSAQPGEAPASDAPLLQRYTLVDILEERQVGDWVWYRVGKDQWVEQRNVGMVTPSSPPEGVGPNEKWIEVDLFEQTLAAYEGDRLVYATLVSSGLPWWKTQTGLFRIWGKVQQAPMSGRAGYPDYYYLEDVPYAMYFYNSFALHTAYWHDRFGFPHSHGCVNLSPQDAQWLFDWVTPTAAQTNWTMSTGENPGTWVWVHD
jgi:hypothetical protein